MCHKKKLKFENYKNCLEANQLYNKNVYLEKNGNNADNHKELIKNNKFISKTQQRFKSERHDIFTKKISKIVLS